MAADLGLSSAIFGDSIFESFAYVFTLFDIQLQEIYYFFSGHPAFILFLLVPVVGLGVSLFRRFLDL